MHKGMLFAATAALAMCLASTQLVEARGFYSGSRGVSVGFHRGGFYGGGFRRGGFYRGGRRGAVRVYGGRGFYGGRSRGYFRGYRRY